MSQDEDNLPGGNYLGQEDIGVGGCLLSPQFLHISQGQGGLVYGADLRS